MPKYKKGKRAMEDSCLCSCNLSHFPFFLSPSTSNQATSHYPKLLQGPGPIQGQWGRRGQQGQRGRRGHRGHRSPNECKLPSPIDFATEPNDNTFQFDKPQELAWNDEEDEWIPEEHPGIDHGNLIPEPETQEGLGDVRFVLPLMGWMLVVDGCSCHHLNDLKLSAFF